MKPFRAFCLLLTLPLLWLAHTPASAQNSGNRPENSFMDRVFFGGGLGLQFGTLTLIDVSPVIGYRVTERFEAGLGFTYKYYKYKDYYVDLNTGTSYDLKSNILGGSVFGRYHITESIFAHAEYETLNYRYEDYYSYGGSILSDKRTAVINSIFIGGGYRQPISERVILLYHGPVEPQRRRHVALFQSCAENGGNPRKVKVTDSVSLRLVMVGN